MAGGSLPRRDGHSSGTRIAARLEQPTRTTRHRNLPLPACAGSIVPIRFCSRWGLPCRPRCRVRGALLPHLFTLTSPEKPKLSSARRFDLCGAFPGVAPAGCYPAPYVDGARTFLPGDLSIVAGAAVRPTDARGHGRYHPSGQAKCGFVGGRSGPLSREPVNPPPEQASAA